MKAIKFACRFLDNTLTNRKEKIASVDGIRIIKIQQLICLLKYTLCSILLKNNYLLLQVNEMALRLNYFNWLFKTFPSWYWLMLWHYYLVVGSSPVFLYVSLRWEGVGRILTTEVKSKLSSFNIVMCALPVEVSGNSDWKQQHWLVFSPRSPEEQRPIIVITPLLCP